jgi:hypothetical protein
MAGKRRPMKRKKEADGGRRIGRRPTTAGGSYTGEKITNELRVRKT